MVSEAISSASVGILEHTCHKEGPAQAGGLPVRGTSGAGGFLTWIPYDDLSQGGPRSGGLHVRGTSIAGGFLTWIPYD